MVEHQVGQGGLPPVHYRLYTDRTILADREVIDMNLPIYCHCSKYCAGVGGPAHITNLVRQDLS